MRRIVTPSAEHLDLEAETLVRHPDNDVRAFPDGEVYIQLDDVEELDEALVVHAGMPEPNRGLSYLTGLLDLLSGHDVRTEVFFSYMPYGMQDEVFFDGSLNYARALLRRLTDYYGVERVHVVDAHFCHRPWTEEFPFQCLHAFPLLAEDIDMEPCTVLGPDRGAEKRFGIESFSKQRENSYTVSIEGDGDVEGKNVLVFDDIIETGGTMVEMFETLQEQGAERIEAAAVHGVLEDGVERVASTYDDLHLTNSIASEAATTGIEPLVKEIHSSSR